MRRLLLLRAQQGQRVHNGKSNSCNQGNSGRVCCVNDVLLDRAPPPPAARQSLDACPAALYTTTTCLRTKPGQPLTPLKLSIQASTAGQQTQRKKLTTLSGRCSTIKGREDRELLCQHQKRPPSHPSVQQHEGRRLHHILTTAGFNMICKGARESAARGSTNMQHTQNHRSSRPPRCGSGLQESHC